VHKSIYTVVGVASVWMFFICLAYLTLYIQSPVTELLIDAEVFSRALTVYSIAYLTDCLSVLIFLLVMLYSLSFICKVSVKNIAAYFVFGFVLGYIFLPDELVITISTVIQVITAILIGVYFTKFQSSIPNKKINKDT
jgi:hypothetical protein